ncbi:nitroreductase [Candidatus Fermentibacteria bacterium]|nr:nitroreductase [Candidatus Fermentibacteria bacterium]
MGDTVGYPRAASGIVFLKATDLEGVRNFYQDQLGMTVWLRQADCLLLRHGNMVLGFCDRGTDSFDGLLTFVYPDRAGVDRMYQRLTDRAESAPEESEKYGIYQFFASDPEGRRLEFQAFLHPTEPIVSGCDLLVSRRSVRRFLDTKIPEEKLQQVLELCRYSPTSRHSESYYFVATSNRENLEFLAGLRGSSSAPIGEAPMAVAACSDPSKSGGYVQDACIAAYHFILAATVHGLGTCWMAGMDRAEVKDCLGIPLEHHVATVTPVGFPAESPQPKQRRDAGSLIR